MTSVASSGIGMDQSASASNEGVGKLLLTRKPLTIAVFLAISEDSSIILFVEVMSAVFAVLFSRKCGEGEQVKVEVHLSLALCKVR